MTLAVTGWICEADARTGGEMWHRWSTIPGDPTGVWGWGRWCRKNPIAYAAPSSLEEWPPAGASVCRRCRAPVAAWDDAGPLACRPLTLAEANALVAAIHRHHEPVTGHRFSIGAEKNGKLVGAIIVGRPVAPKTNQTYIFEATRCVTDGTHNACSFLYARAARVAEAMGAWSIQTFTLPAEGGASLRAAGWTEEETIEPPPNGWNSRAHRGDMPLFGIVKEAVGGTKVRWRRSFPANQPSAINGLTEAGERLAREQA